MKKTAKIFALVIAAALLLSIACSCRSTRLRGEVTFVISGKEEKVYTQELYEIEITKGAFSVLEYIGEKNGFAVEISNGMLMRVGDLVPEGNSYICIWTSEETDFDVSAWMPETLNKTWNGKTLTRSGVGISDMTVKNGTVIYIGMSTY